MTTVPGPINKVAILAKPVDSLLNSRMRTALDMRAPARKSILLRHALTPEQLHTIATLLADYREGVASGSISGYGQPLNDELSDTDELVALFQEAWSS